MIGRKGIGGRNMSAWRRSVPHLAHKYKASILVSSSSFFLAMAETISLSRDNCPEAPRCSGILRKVALSQPFKSVGLWPR